MKLKLILPALIMLSLQGFSQTKNNISVVYGISIAPVDIHGAIGDYGYDTKTGIATGLVYTRQITKSFSLQTGFLYANDKVELNVIEGRLGMVVSDGSVNIISIPVYAKLTFLRYLFFDSGLSAGFQTNYEKNGVINDQSGLGGEVGVGLQAPLGKIVIFVNPYFHEYNITAADNNLFEFGVKLGLGYNF
jgi:hypothetical protein